MEDTSAIIQLVARERQCRVRYLDEELASCFWEDATVQTSWSRGKAGNYLKGGQERAKTQKKEQTIVNRTGVPVVHQKGDRAYVELPSTTVKMLPLDGKEAVLTSYMRILYWVEKRQGEWRIFSFRTINEADTLAPALPGEDLEINREEVEMYRHSYRYLAYTVRHTGGTISDDLPGIDRPETAEAVYAASEAYLNRE